MEKKLLDTVLKRIKHGALTVRYWDDREEAYGIGEPLVGVTIKSAKAARKMLRQLTVGFGEGYVAGDIEVDGPLDAIMRLASENKPALRGTNSMRWVRAQSQNIRENQRHQIAHHYDIGNDFYKLWLDKSMAYSCAYYRTKHDTLEAAQEQKIEHLLRKLQLRRGMRLLDIGCGWGTLLITAAREYGVSGLGITLSENQQKYAAEAARKAGVADKVEFRLMNYQDLAEQHEMFDCIISVGMYEHVGRGNHETYFKAIDKMLKPQSISVLHCITHTHETPTDPWIDKYIFPGGYVPSVRETVAHLPRYNFQLTDYENLRIHYAMTLDEWWARFEQHKAKIIDMYDEKFYRMWKLYLASSSAAFRYGDLTLSQFVFTKGSNNDLPLTREFLYK